MHLKAKPGTGKGGEKSDRPDALNRPPPEPVSEVDGDPGQVLILLQRDLQEHPASFASGAMVGELRNAFGFQNVVISDLVAGVRYSPMFGLRMMAMGKIEFNEQKSISLAMAFNPVNPLDSGFAGEINDIGLGDILGWGIKTFLTEGGGVADWIVGVLNTVLYVRHLRLQVCGTTAKIDVPRFKGTVPKGKDAIKALMDSEMKSNDIVEWQQVTFRQGFYFDLDVHLFGFIDVTLNVALDQEDPLVTLSLHQHVLNR